MPTWNRARQLPPGALAQLQTAANRPDIQAQIEALRSSARSRSMATGQSGWDGLQQQIRRIYEGAGIQIPEGYDVDQDGQIVYTNETPWLRQAAIASLPIAVPSAIQALAGGGAAAAGSGASAGGGVPNLAGAAGLPGGAMYSAAASAPGAGGIGAGLGAAAGVGGAGAAGGSSLLGRILTGLRDYGPLGLAGINAVNQLRPGGPGGTTDAERQLNEILGMARGRVEASEPLFQQLNTMARRQLPVYTREGR